MAAADRASQAMDARTNPADGIVTEMSGFLRSSSGTANTILGDTGAKDPSGAREQDHQPLLTQ
jgi:hypothetical protein